MGIGVVYGLYPSYKTPMTKTATVIYAAVSRFVWAVALAWVVYACKYGYGGKSSDVDFTKLFPNLGLVGVETLHGGNTILW